MPYRSNQQLRMAYCSKRLKGIRLVRHGLTSQEHLLLSDEDFFVRSLIGKQVGVQNLARLSKSETDPHCMLSSRFHHYFLFVTPSFNQRVCIWLKTTCVKLRLISVLGSNVIIRTDCKFCLVESNSYTKLCFLFLNFGRGTIQQRKIQQRCHNERCQAVANKIWPVLKLSHYDVYDMAHAYRSRSCLVKKPKVSSYLGMKGQAVRCVHSIFLQACTFLLT